LIGFTGAT